MTLTCRAVRLQLPSMDDPGSFEGPLAEHTAACLRCQAEISRYRRLGRSLGLLADEVYLAPAGLAVAVEGRIADGGAAWEQAPGRASRVAAAAGAVVAAAGTVAMVRWMRARSAA
jgi:hypothetical protein